MTQALRRLEDAGGRSVEDLVASLELTAAGPAGARPRVAGAMIASVDGRAAVQGRSVALGHPADRALLRELRTAADAILVGTATLAAERYATLLDPEQRRRRVAAGRAEHPILATVSRRLALPLAEAPVFAEAGTPIVVVTASDAVPPVVAAELDVVRVADGTPPLPVALDALAQRGVRGVLCEGGPTLLRELVAQGCLDDLLLTVSPLVAAGDAPSVLTGAALDAPAALTLEAVHRADDHLFLHYRTRRA